MKHWTSRPGLPRKRTWQSWQMRLVLLLQWMRQSLLWETSMLDVFASETGTDRKIIIENQLEDTNHDHLGKLITYASGKSQM